ncbi:MAG: ferredoxin-thioredoxin reductase catalytic domain-containing protein [Myxococcota bacterium]
MAEPTGDQPSEKSLKKMRRFVEKYAEKTGTATHPDEGVTEAVVLGLAGHVDELGKPLCPCRFYPDKEAEVQHRTWICACEDMKIYKYCHCLLFVREDGMPITEHLPEDHEGRQTWGLVEDPTPDKGRERKGHEAEREQERRERPS